MFVEKYLSSPPSFTSLRCRISFHTSFCITGHLSNSDPHLSLGLWLLILCYTLNSINFCLFVCCIFYLKMLYILMSHSKYAFALFKLLHSTWNNFLSKLIYFHSERFIFYNSIYWFYFIFVWLLPHYYPSWYSLTLYENTP